MSDVVLPLIGIVVALVLGLWLYGRFSGASDAAIAVAGVFRNLFLGALALLSIATGTWIGVLGGALLLIVAVFLGSSHADTLTGGTIRRRIAP